MIDNLLLYLFLVSFLLAFAVYFIGRKIGKQVSWLVFITFLGISLVYVGLFPTVMHEGILEEYPWVSSPINLTFGLLADGLSVPIVFTYMFVFAFTTLFSRTYMERRLKLGDIEENNEQYMLHAIYKLDRILPVFRDGPSVFMVTGPLIWIRR
jgi:formate hydrogenlyase subunit 3/multisubunit Na+/H+ antiporter MnhD subunit